MVKFVSDIEMAGSVFPKILFHILFSSGDMKVQNWGPYPRDNKINNVKELERILYLVS